MRPKRESKERAIALMAVQDDDLYFFENEEEEELKIREDQEEEEEREVGEDEEEEKKMNMSTRKKKKKRKRSKRVLRSSISKRQRSQQISFISGVCGFDDTLSSSPPNAPHLGSKWTPLQSFLEFCDKSTDFHNGLCIHS